ncbi:CYP enzymes assisting alcohol dehydrogenase-like [Vitis riparia]|uniref:CYP enzymes assisting alcohol dehydrogenase-like n=1 Tax=Vitis riparia TaxID=96939 RepID=UPI00155B3381|nr:CYP enzymes assisting alcohol dehydrogenase-like [Vitis riparia]
MIMLKSAATCWGAGEAVKLEEIQVKPPKSSEVRVKMLYASLSHTDILYCSGFHCLCFREFQAMKALVIHVAGKWTHAFNQD